MALVQIQRMDTLPRSTLPIREYHRGAQGYSPLGAASYNGDVEVIAVGLWVKTATWWVDFP